MPRAVCVLVLLASPLAALSACGTESTSDETAQAEPKGQVSTIDAKALAAKVDAGEVRLIDVRSPEEFADGHIAGAVNMPVDVFDPAEVEDVEGKQTILYCRSGRRSGVAAEAMAAAGRDAVHLGGGILAWEEAGQPVTE